MKQIDYSINDLLSNLKQNKKRVIIIFITLMLISIVVSFFLTRDYVQKEPDRDNTVVPQIVLDEYDKDETYFYSVSYDLKMMAGALDAYAQYLHQVNLNGGNNEQLVRFQEDLSDNTPLFDDIIQYYLSNGPIYADDQEAAVTYVNQHVEDLEASIDTIGKMIEQQEDYSFAADVNTENIALFEQQVQYEEELAGWEKQRYNLVNGDIETLASINRQMEKMLQQGVEAYNALVLQFNEMISDFEDEQYDIIYNPYLLEAYTSEAGITGELEKENIMNVDKNSALIYARSIAGLDSSTERFYSSLTFGFLLSIGLSVLYGLFGRRSISEDTK